jgi:hypothetical protein
MNEFYQLNKKCGYVYRRSLLELNYLFELIMQTGVARLAQK